MAGQFGLARSHFFHRWFQACGNSPGKRLISVCAAHRFNVQRSPRPAGLTRSAEGGFPSTLTTKARGLISGYGWEQNVEHTMALLNATIDLPETINMVGWREQGQDHYLGRVILALLHGTG